MCDHLNSTGFAWALGPWAPRWCLVHQPVTQTVLETKYGCFNGGMGDYVFCLVGQCNTIKIPLQCLIYCSAIRKLLNIAYLYS
jgi:hypothetical protein